MTYEETIKMLAVLDESQLIQLFHDVCAKSNVAHIERIADCAYHYIENVYEEKEISDDEDARQVDDLCRAHEYRSDSRRPY